MEPKIWSRVQPHGGTQIPQEIRLKLELNPGDVLLWTDIGLGKVVMMKGKLEEVATERLAHTSR